MGGHSNLVGRAGQQYAGRVSSTGRTPKGGIKPPRKRSAPGENMRERVHIGGGINAKGGALIGTTGHTRIVNTGTIVTFKSKTVTFKGKKKTIKGGTKTLVVRYIRGREYIFFKGGRRPVSKGLFKKGGIIFTE